MVTMSRKEQKERTRARILDTAADLFRRKGFIEVATSEVAMGAGVSHGTVFAHFPTRDGLIDAVIRGFTTPLMERVYSASSEGKGVLPLLKAHLEALSEDEDLYYRLVTEGRHLPQAASDALASINSVIARYFEEAAESEGCTAVRREPGLAFVFNLWIGMINHYVMNRDLFTPGVSVLKERGPGLAEGFHSLIQPKATVMEDGKDE